jgi:hypothetical protein
VISCDAPIAWGKAIFGYPWAVLQLFSDYLRILKDKCAPGLEWALHNPPKPHAFTSLPLQSSVNGGGSEDNEEKSTTSESESESEFEGNETAKDEIKIYEHQIKKYEELWDIARDADEGIPLTEEQKDQWNDARQDLDGEEIRSQLGEPSRENLKEEIDRTQERLDHYKRVDDGASVLTEDRSDYDSSEDENNFLPFIVIGSIFELPFIGYVLRAFAYYLVYMLDISLLPEVLVALEPIITAYRIYKLPSRVRKLFSLLVRIYNYVITSKIIISSIILSSILFWVFNFSVISIFIGLCSLFIVFFSFSFYVSAISCDEIITSLSRCDAPRKCGVYFQDSASPQMEAIVELHDNIMYYLVAILFAVGWIQAAIIKNFDSSNSPISNKYLNHGRSVPAQKCSKIKWNSL